MMVYTPVLKVVSRRVFIFGSLLLLLSACTTHDLKNDDLDQLLAAFEANNARIEQRRKEALERGITHLDVVKHGNDPDGVQVSADLDDARLQIVLERILELSKVPYSIEAPTIHGTVSAHFAARPLLTTLNLLLEPKGLSAILRDGIIVISSGSSADVSEAELTDPFSVQPTISVIEYPLRYLKTRRAQAILDQLFPVNEDTGLRPIGVAERPENNSILITGPQSDIDFASELLRVLDIDTGHIMIEALVVEFNTESFLDIGWRLAQGAKGNFSDVFVDLADLVGDTISFTMASDAANTTTFMAVINLLMQEEQARVISRPYVATTSGTPAQLEIAEDRFVVSSVPGVEEITLGEISSGVKLDITPVVTVDRLIQLDMNISESRFVPSLENVEQRRTRNSVTTSARVEDGQTVIIGGLMLATQGHSVAGIPGLRDVPGLNLVFGHTDEATQRTQVLIFVTPHLWTPGIRTPVRSLQPLEIYNDNIVHTPLPEIEPSEEPAQP